MIGLSPKRDWISKRVNNSWLVLFFEKRSNNHFSFVKNKADSFFFNFVFVLDFKIRSPVSGVDHVYLLGKMIEGSKDAGLTASSLFLDVQNAYYDTDSSTDCGKSCGKELSEEICGE